MLLLGSGRFVDRVKELLKGHKREQTALREVSKGTLSWEEITAAVSKLRGEEWQMLKSGYGTGELPAALYLGRNYSGKSLRELGELAGGIQYPAITMAVRRFTLRLNTDAPLARKMRRLRSMSLVKA
jgi:predicted CopG family antitoxin